MTSRTSSHLNEIKRYSIVTKNKNLKLNGDGSVTFYVQADPPMRPLPWQGAQTTLRAAVEVHRPRSARMVAPEPATARRSAAASQSAWACDDTLQRRSAIGTCSCQSDDRAAQPQRQTRLSAHLDAHDPHASSAVGRAVQHHRAVARTRELEHDAPLRRGQPGDEGKSPDSPRSTGLQLKRFRATDELMRFLQAL
jgi:hypothetical protein